MEVRGHESISAMQVVVVMAVWRAKRRRWRGRRGESVFEVGEGWRVSRGEGRGG